MQFRILKGVGSRVQGSGLRVKSLGFRVKGLRCRVQDLGFRVWVTRSSVACHPVQGAGMGGVGPGDDTSAWTPVEFGVEGLGLTVYSCRPSGLGIRG